MHAPLICSAAVGASMLAGASGCSQRTYVEFDGAREYPLGVLQGETLNVQVFRDGTNIELTNTSATPLSEGVLWLNEWWSLDVEALPPGASVRLALKSFKDKYGAPFRAGGFFATRIPDILVLAQWDTGEELLGLVVVENRVN